MSAVSIAHSLTREIKKLLEYITREQREEHINKLLELLDQRQIWIERIPSAVTATEQVLGREIVQMNKEINHKLNIILRDIKTDIQKEKQKSVHAKKYLNPYQSISNLDGRFLDQKK